MDSLKIHVFLETELRAVFNKIRTSNQNLALNMLRETHPPVPVVNRRLGFGLAVFIAVYMALTVCFILLT